MKGIYLTERTKKELELKIATLKKEQENEGEALYITNKTMIIVYEEILSSAIVLPIEQSWEDIYDMLSINTLPNHSYKNGVIIQPKN
jgi:hypothetical protein